MFARHAALSPSSKVEVLAYTALHVKHSLGDLVAERKIVIPRVQYKCVRVKERKRGMDNCNRMCESAYREQVCTNVFV